MLIVYPGAYGMCFGVKDALAQLVGPARSTPRPKDATIWGELMHNPDINHKLRCLGYTLEPENARTLPATPVVVITAHGVSDAQRRALLEAGKEIVDTTCPLVRKVHRSAMLLHQQGYHIVIVGKSGHVEVEGLVGDLEHFSVVSGPSQVAALSAARIAVLAQTTTPPALFRETCERLRMLHPDREVRVQDTICQPTRDRQRAMEELLPRVDAVVVVGGRSSNNTIRLCEVARQYGKRCYHVERPEDLRSQWFEGTDIVGLAAGTSTPDETIRAVHRRLLEIGAPARKQRSQPQRISPSRVPIRV